MSTGHWCYETERKAEMIGEIPLTMPMSPSQVPYEPARHRHLDSVVSGRRLTADTRRGHRQETPSKTRRKDEFI